MRQALLKFNSLPGALNNLHTKFHHRPHKDYTHSRQHNKNSITTNNRNLFLVVPYSKGLNKRFSKTCRGLGIEVHFKGSNIICNLLVVPKDKDSTVQKSGVFYRQKCTQADCEEEYIGKLERIFGERIKEQLRVQSPIYQCSQATGHPMSVDCFTIIGMGAHGTTRTIKEAMYI